MSSEMMVEYGFSPKNEADENAMMQVEQSRAVAEVQSAYVIAKRFPRDEMTAFNKIMKACERPFLAEQAMYAFPRGGQVVTGPSIRLAEVLAQCWGNCDAGIREISQVNGVSIAEAYAIDLETNNRSTKIFHVPHDRYTKKGKTRLTDPRDIYELVANNGSRRMRACILAIIPGDIVDAAIDQCKKTLTNGKEPLQDRIRKMVVALDEQGIKIEHIEKRLGHKLDAIIEPELITLRGIYKSIKDGMAKREDFFDIDTSPAVLENVNNLIAEKQKTVKAEDSKPVESATFTEYEKVKKALLNAKSKDTLDIAADLIGTCETAEQHDELLAIYNKRKTEVK